MHHPLVHCHHAIKLKSGKSVNHAPLKQSILLYITHPSPTFPGDWGAVLGYGLVSDLYIAGSDAAEEIKTRHIIIKMEEYAVKNNFIK